jgi:hypothetical protein
MIKPKLKECSVCKKQVVLWKSKPKLCKDCAMKQKIEQDSGLKLPSVPNKFFKISPVSKNREAALAKYRRLRDAYFKEHPICEFPGCTSKQITLHHKRGRIGAFLTDKRHFCSLCHKHHTWVNENNAEAFKLGLVASRLGK